MKEPTRAVRNEMSVNMLNVHSSQFKCGDGGMLVWYWTGHITDEAPTCFNSQ